MKCFAAHYLYLGAGRLAIRQVVCLDEEGCICSIQPLEEETASTIFMDGLLCAAFGLPGSKIPITPAEATLMLETIRKTNPDCRLPELLQTQTNDSMLQVGNKTMLWCIDSLNLKELLLLEETSVYTVFP